MCSPALALGAQAAGAVSQTVGSYYAAQGQQASLRAQADAANLQARGVMLASERDQQRSKLATANLKGRQRAAMAANGVDLAGGSAQNVLNTTDVMGTIDANTIESNALAQAWGYQAQALQSRAQAGAISPMLSALGTGISGATQVAGSWYKFKQAGGLDVPKVDNIGPAVPTAWAY